ncbi:MAG: AMP-binding protein, partial [Catalinimonas sp.]
MSASRPLWTPPDEHVQNSHLTHYLDWLNIRRGIKFSDYHALWSWSVEHPEAFWTSVWQYFDVASSAPYDKVLSGAMPNARWFAGSRLNYAAHVFRRADAGRPALLFQSEHVPLTEISWAELEAETAALAHHLRQAGVRRGDRVVAYLPNVPAATVGFLAAAALGAVWSSCSPDFGVGGVVDRFQQIEPKVLIAVDGYRYGGKAFDKRAAVRALREALPTLTETILLPYLDPEATLDGTTPWAEATATRTPLVFADVPF